MPNIWNQSHHPERYIRLDSLVVVKFGGGALGVDGALIPRIIQRVKRLKQSAKVVVVFSAPQTNYREKIVSMTDLAINVGRSYASSNPVEIDVLRVVYENIASRYLQGNYHKEFSDYLEKFFRNIIISLKQAAENRRFVDVIRSRTLAYSGEITMACLMDYIMKSHGLKSAHVDLERWPIITDDNFEAANFMLEESTKQIGYLVDLIERVEVVCLGGFIGKTVDGLETTYERGGSDRTAADIAILLRNRYETSIDFEKDSAVLSADPKIVTHDLEYVRYLSYNEAILAGMFGMKILDPAAIKEIDDNGLDIPIVITNMKDPSSTTLIQKNLSKLEEKNFVKIITGKKNCAIVRMESTAASHLVATLERDKQYHDFIKLSPYKHDDVEITRLLFLDADYVRRQERHFRAYNHRAQIVYERGVVTLIGDLMWKVPKIASNASSTVGEHGINILNLDAQEETSRILIIVEDKSVAAAVKAVHSKRNQIHSGKTI
jgi:aspartate kinase